VTPKPLLRSLIIPLLLVVGSALVLFPPVELDAHHRPGHKPTVTPTRTLPPVTATPTSTLPGPTATRTPTPITTPTPTSTPASAAPVFVGAGDIASCTSSGDEATAALLDTIPGTVYTLGDNVYPNGTSSEFTNCYAPSWGRHKARTRPAPGNHDYNTSGASGYFAYFGANAGPSSRGYYSYDLGTWHIISLNSDIAHDAGSPQEQWLRADLAANPVACTLAYWHKPRFSSGSVHGNDASMDAFWRALYQFGADIVLSGHVHNYERFAPQNPAGQADASRGIRQFIVGTGGVPHYGFGTVQPNSQVRNSDTHGLLKLTLHGSSYDWQFVPQAGKSFTDSGTAPCH
jgi:acid phosphatase type 7